MVHGYVCDLFMYPHHLRFISLVSPKRRRLRKRPRPVPSDIPPYITCNVSGGGVRCLSVEKGFHDRCLIVVPCSFFSNSFLTSEHSLVSFLLNTFSRSG